MTSALIGHSGFIGSLLQTQTHFDNLYRSSSIHQIRHSSFDLVLCAGASATKWIANNNPVSDKKNIENLIDHLQTIQSKLFILISTVDVFHHPVGVNESTKIDEASLHPYGLHRRLLEKFVIQHFPCHLIVRLPGVVGPGLRKNIIYDFLHNHQINAIDNKSIFQFYPMVNLWYDIQKALQAGLSIVHLTSEPLTVADVSLHGFGKVFTQSSAKATPHYDMQTMYANIFEATGRYQYSARESIQAIRAYAQSELLNHPPTNHSTL